MKELPEIFPALAAVHEFGLKTSSAGLLTEAARLAGYKGRQATVSDDLVLEMVRGERNADPRLQELSREAVAAHGLAPLTRDTMKALSDIDAAATNASSILAETESDQKGKEIELAKVLCLLRARMTEVEPMLEQARIGFPSAISGGEEESFQGLVWYGSVRYRAAAAGNSLLDVAEEVNERCATGALVHSSFVSEWCHDVDSLIGSGEARVAFLSKMASLFRDAAKNFDGASRKTDAHERFCRYMAACARGNEDAVRSELQEIGDNLREYSNYDGRARDAAVRAVLEYERSQAHIPPSMRRARLLKDAQLITEFRQHDHRAIRNVTYDAIKDGDSRTLDVCLPILQKMWACRSEREVFGKVPPRAPHTSKLVEELSLQASYAKYPAIAARAGWVRKATVVIAAVLGFGLLSLALAPVWRGTPEVAHIGAPGVDVLRNPEAAVQNHRIKEARQGKERLG